MLLVISFLCSMFYSQHMAPFRSFPQSLPISRPVPSSKIGPLKTPRYEGDGLANLRCLVNWNQCLWFEFLCFVMLFYLSLFLQMFSIFVSLMLLLRVISYHCFKCFTMRFLFYRQFASSYQSPIVMFLDFSHLVLNFNIFKSKYMYVLSGIKFKKYM